MGHDFVPCPGFKPIQAQDILYITLQCSKREYKHNFLWLRLKNYAEIMLSHYYKLNNLLVTTKINANIYNYTMFRQGENRICTVVWVKRFFATAVPFPASESDVIL
jgi:hypothetical protein